MEQITEQTDVIPESKAARWAYHLALIPILGFFLYMFAAFVALYRIGKGRSGFLLLRKGFWRMLRMTTAGVVGFAACWFCPYYDMERFESGSYFGNASLIKSNSLWRNYDIMSPSEYKLSYEDLKSIPFGVGLKMRDLHGKPIKIGKWQYRNESNSTKFEGSYSCGKQHGTWSYYHGNGIKVAQIEYVNGKPTHNWSRWYSDGQIKDKEEPLSDGKTYRFSEWNRNGMKMVEGCFVFIARGKADFMLQFRRGDFSLRGYGSTNIPEIDLDQYKLLPAEVGQWNKWNEKGSLVATDLYNESSLVVKQNVKPFYFHGKQYSPFISFPSILWTAVDIGEN